MSPCPTQRFFAQSMFGAATAAGTYRARIAPRVSADWATLVDGDLPDADGLMAFLARISAVISTRTMDGNQDLDRAKIELARRREAWQACTAELRGEMLAIKRVLEGLLGPVEGRRFINCPAALPTAAQELASAARLAATNLRDPDRALPAGVPMVIDRTGWADHLEARAAELDEAGRQVLFQREQVGIERDKRGQGLTDLERQGRAAWLMLKGLMLFNNQPGLLKAVERLRRPRRKRALAAEAETRLEAIPIAISNPGWPDLVEEPLASEAVAYLEERAREAPVAYLEQRVTEPSEDEECRDVAPAPSTKASTPSSEPPKKTTKWESHKSQCRDGAPAPSSKQHQNEDDPEAGQTKISKDQGNGGRRGAPSGEQHQYEDDPEGGQPNVSKDQTNEERGPA